MSELKNVKKIQEYIFIFWLKFRLSLFLSYKALTILLYEILIKALILISIVLGSLIVLSLGILLMTVLNLRNIWVNTYQKVGIAHGNYRVTLFRRDYTRLKSKLARMFVGD